MKGDNIVKLATLNLYAKHQNNNYMDYLICPSQKSHKISNTVCCWVFCVCVCFFFFTYQEVKAEYVKDTDKLTVKQWDIYIYTYMGYIYIYIFQKLVKNIME